MYQRITLLVIFVFCFFQVEAQIMQGDKFLGGSIFFLHNTTEDLSSSSNDEKAKRITLDIAPQIAFFISDFMAIGTELSYRFTKSKQDYLLSFGGTVFQESEQHLIGIAPFAKVYWKLAKRAGFTLNVSTGVGIGNRETDEFNSSARVKSDVFKLNLNVKPQFYYFITPRIGIEASFGGLVYQYQQIRGGKEFERWEVNQSDFSSTFGSGLALSFNYYFGKRFQKPAKETD